MRFITAAFAATALAFSSAQAAEPGEPPITNPDQIIKNVTEQTLVDLLKELGAQQVEVKEYNGKRQIVFFDGGVPYNMAADICNIRPGKCIGVTMIVLVESSGGGTSLEVLNTANRGNLYLTVFKLDNARFGVGNVQLIDGGVTKRNLAINIASFVVTFNQVMNEMKNQTVASLQQTGPFGQGAFQRASATPIPRPVVATPNEMAAITGQMTKSIATKLGPQRY
jgi:hypothetical protein